MNQSKSAQASMPAATTPATPDVPGEAPALQPPIQDHIGRQLRAVYDDVLSQPIPDRLRELLERLDESSGGAS